jgi:hypothetical protein
MLLFPKLSKSNFVLAFLAQDYFVIITAAELKKYILSPAILTTPGTVAFSVNCIVLIHVLPRIRMHTQKIGIVIQ